MIAAVVPASNPHGLDQAGKGASRCELKGVIVGDCVGDKYRLMTEDTRSLDHGSC